MTDGASPTASEIEALYQKLNREAEAGGYHLNPDMPFSRELAKGILVNQKRYGYGACPCRIAAGIKAEDMDIICPCDYRDPDLSDYGTCYCGLYVSGEVVAGKKKIGSIPERRPPPKARKAAKAEKTTGGSSRFPMPVWRCRVCGYLCAREGPPDNCPICKAAKERFERFA
jgi:ferredoxin-thioredoxin reductase catalytic subunit